MQLYQGSARIDATGEASLLRSAETGSLLEACILPADKYRDIPSFLQKKSVLQGQSLPGLSLYGYS